MDGDVGGVEILGDVGLRYWAIWVLVNLLHIILFGKLKEKKLA